MSYRFILKLAMIFTIVNNAYSWENFHSNSYPFCSDSQTAKELILDEKILYFDNKDSNAKFEEIKLNLKGKFKDYCSKDLGVREIASQIYNNCYSSVNKLFKSQTEDSLKISKSCYEGWLKALGYAEANEAALKFITDKSYQRQKEWERSLKEPSKNCNGVVNTEERKAIQKIDSTDVDKIGDAMKTNNIEK